MFDDDSGNRIILQNLENTINKYSALKLILLNNADSII